ncbi:MAG: 5-dehydro-4-deoxy-D-glucuronate isomerase, partial [Marivirga sp.]|nr:5-dehydro-4-deoxy-D-glucuronate isomerase [Marivirga sp.]
MTHQIRHAIHPNDFKSLHTHQLRDAFLLPGSFEGDKINVCYTHYDR